MHSLAAVAVNPLCKSTDSLLTFEQATRKLFAASAAPTHAQLLEWVQTIPSQLLLDELRRRKTEVFSRTLYRSGTFLAAVLCGGSIAIALSRLRRPLHLDGAASTQFAELDRMDPAYWLPDPYDAPDMLDAIESAGGVRAIANDARRQYAHAVALAALVEQQWPDGRKCVDQLYRPLRFVMLLRHVERFFRIFHKGMPPLCAYFVGFSRSRLMAYASCFRRELTTTAASIAEKGGA